jgi:phospholipase/carboxylesterase
MGEIIMKHIFKKGDSKKPVFLLLHGTGGNESDLLPLAEMIDPAASVLGVRGSVSENGMPRFFKRLAEGVFDEDDLKIRTKELYEFIQQSSETYGFDPKNIVPIGYSNGANIAANLLFHYENIFGKAILFHPMIPMRGIELPKLNQTSVFIGAGENDPICLPEETKDLAKMLKSAHASVVIHWERMGHQLTQSEVEAARDWYHQD